ncbi:MAG: phosphatidate cytidylyltransferase [Methyloligellaceae bacterium]
MSDGQAHSSEHRRPEATTPPELMIRVASALVLAVLALLITRAGLWPFTILICAGAIIASWEWGRLVRASAFDAVVVCHAAAVAAAVLLSAAQRLELAFLALGIGLAVVGLLAAPRRNSTWSMIGFAYIGLPAVALVVVRGDTELGWLAIAYLFSIVWCADTAAYAIGRLIGGPKLAPRISPNKTWSGFVAGIVFPSLVALGWAVWLGNTSLLHLPLLGAGLALTVQIGDLSESATKRRFHVKDAGHLIPGHGGLLDRIDGFLFAALASGVILTLRSDLPSGAALLIWP